MSDESRAFGPGSRSRPLLLAAAVLAVAAVAVLIAGRTGSSHTGAGRPRAGHPSAAGASAAGTPAAAGASHAARATHRRASISSGAYGYIPSWIPHSKVHVGRVVTATPAHHRLGIEGDTISVRLPTGRALVTTVGPQVPEEGRFPVPATTRCTFLVTLIALRGSVPIKPHAFTALDERGVIHRLRVRTRAGGPIPTSLSPGRPLTLIMSAVLPTGQGRVRWIPLGHSPIAAWDFDVEID